MPEVYHAPRTTRLEILQAFVLGGTMAMDFMVATPFSVAAGCLGLGRAS